MHSETSFFTKIAISICDFRKYSQFISETAGKAVCYLLLMSLLFGCISLSRPIYEFNSGVSEVSDLLNNNLPDFVLENGQLVANNNQPLFYNGEGVAIILDTSGQTDISALDNYKKGLLLLKDRYILKKSPTETRIVDYREFQAFTITDDDLKAWFPALKWLSIIILVFGIAYFFVCKLCSVLFLSIFGLIINGLKKSNLSYRQIFIISIYALTLPIIAKSAVSVAEINIPFFWLIYHGIGVFYILEAISSIMKTKESELQEENPCSQ